MAKEIVSRRGFLSGTAGALAARGATLLTTDTVGKDLNKPLSLEQMADALYEAAGRYSDRNAPFFDEPLPRSSTGRILSFAMEHLRHCSVDEI